ncbi:hypothetical protein WA026_015435 [Henosepilachna vigintioctopunctata]|uniref:Exonuclease domain-containing protein n=1 Tax=Henosepilachna vigintioctopunctata TaxID=420089 RepID=A0AAW1UPD0_9CUCU
MENRMHSITEIRTQMSGSNNLSCVPTRNEFGQIHLDEQEFLEKVRTYVLAPEELYTLGFPVEFCGRVRILHSPFPFASYDQNKNKKQERTNNACKSKFEQNCARCGCSFYFPCTQYLPQDKCYYHFGKLKYQSGEGNMDSVFTCCGKPFNAKGCSVGQFHVWSGLENGVNDNLRGFVKTQRTINNWIEPGIYSLDCEMCYTINGMELCRVTVVGIDGGLLYSTFVKPEYQVVDFNTRFSGVTERDVTLNGITLPEVQRDLLSFINEGTILVGHSIHNDLRALKILHRNIVDISLIFPHHLGYPYRYSLKQLTLNCLHKHIQSSDYGHDPYEDALSSMELLMWSIVQDLLKKTNNNN